MNMNWNEVKGKIRTQISRPSYETWFSATTIHLEDDVLTIYCPNEFARDWLESHYKELIFNTLREMFHTTFEIQFDILIDEPSQLNGVQKEKIHIWDEVKKTLRPKLTEKSFVKWIKNTNATLEGNKLMIFCEDAFHRDVLEGEYKDLISSTVQKVTNKKYNIWFYIESNTAPIAHVPNIQDNQLSSIHEGNETLWQEIKEKIQLQISRPSYETWVKKTTAHINGNALIIYFENEFQQQWVEKSYKDLISKIAEELTGNTYEIQFELQSNEIAIGIVETSKTSSNNDIFELWGQLKSANQDDKDKRIQALEEKIVSLEKMMSTLVGKLEVIESKTQLEK